MLRGYQDAALIFFVAVNVSFTISEVSRFSAQSHVSQGDVAKVGKVNKKVVNEHG